MVGLRRAALRLNLPFTLAHPAAVLPLRRILVFSALVVGSMAPDFHYFLGLRPHDHFSHSIRGAFIFCLPVGLAVLWLFQHVMKLPLISLAPERHQERLARFAAAFRWGPASRFALIESVNLVTRAELTSSAVGRVISVIGCRVARSIEVSRCRSRCRSGRAR